jgi:hypothetical protein
MQSISGLVAEFVSCNFFGFGFVVLIAGVITPPPFPAQTEAIAPASLSSPVLPCPDRLLPPLCLNKALYGDRNPCPDS